MYLVTGCAGFIGFHVARHLLAHGEAVVGVDNLNPYYSVALKRARLAELERLKSFEFRLVNIADRDELREALSGLAVNKVIHLAAQAGVRHSITHPQDYVSANVAGHVNILEYCRSRGDFESMVYASSSSVYGRNTKLPFSETDRVEKPASLYGATKRADELISYSYSDLYGLPLTGLRFFSVYGPWGRPDMAMWLFTEAILSGQPIKVFNHGAMRRDFTYIDDVVRGVLAVSNSAPKTNEGPPHRLYNIGNNKSEHLLHMIELLEVSLGRKADKEMLPMQAGDVAESCADIDAIRRDYGFEPTTPIEVGIPRFVEWYLSWREASGGI
jgi:UDP-glucuronate 4-epimerase